MTINGSSSRNFLSGRVLYFCGGKLFLLCFWPCGSVISKRLFLYRVWIFYNAEVRSFPGCISTRSPSWQGSEGVNTLRGAQRQMRAIFSLSCPHWHSLSSTAWTSVFHTHAACLGNVHIVLPKSSLLAHVEKGDWLWGSLALRVVFWLLRFKDLGGFEQDSNILNLIFSL